MARAGETVTVRVPGSTSNCGAGFDTLGLALSVYNRITLSRVSEAAGEVRGAVDTAAGARVWPTDANDRRAEGLVAATVAAFFRAADTFGADGRGGGTTPACADVAVASGRRERVREAGFCYHIEGEVPPARGLGSSATIITGVLAGLDALHDTRLTRQRLAAIATAIEGNPDNVSPSLLGGFTVSRCDPRTGDYVDTIRFVVPADVGFVVVSPAVELITKESRGALPKALPFFDAARSVNSAAYLTAAFATGDFGKLRHAVGDFMHEPYRLPKIPGARAAIDAGVAAGALTGWLSGSGSSVLCVVPPARAEAVAAAMRGAFAQAGVASESRTLAADNEGLRVEQLG